MSSKNARCDNACQDDGDDDQGRACRRAGGSQSARTAGVSPLGARPKPLGSCVDAPVDARGFLTAPAMDRVQSCVRP